MRKDLKDLLAHSKNNLIKKVKEKQKTVELKVLLKDMNEHFKTKKYGLNYVMYKDMSKLSFYEFNVWLELNNFKLRYNKLSYCVVIYKKFD